MNKYTVWNSLKKRYITEVRFQLKEWPCWGKCTQPPSEGKPSHLQFSYAILLHIFSSLFALGGRSVKMGQNVVFFYWRKIIVRVWLIRFRKFMSLRAREPPQTGGYACIIGIHLFTLSKLWGRFSQLHNRFIKKNRAQAVFMLRRWIAYQNIAERIRNRSSFLDFSFSALFFFCNMDLKSISCRKIIDFSFFLSEGL